MFISLLYTQIKIQPCQINTISDTQTPRQWVSVSNPDSNLQTKSAGVYLYSS